MIAKRWPAALCALVTSAQVAAQPDAGKALPTQAALEAALRESVRASCPKTKLVIDEALTRAAARFAEAVEEGRAAPSDTALAFYASLESAEPVPIAGIAIADREFADRAVGDLYSRTCRFDRAGAAAARYRDRAVVALLTARHAIDLEPIAGQVDEGAEVTVRGALPAGFHDARLYLLKPGGGVDQRDLSRATPLGPRLADRQFFARVHLDDRGEHTLEVLAEDAGGPHVLAMRRIFVGVDPPSAPPPETPRSDDPKAAGLEAVTDAIAALRAARGLPPLVRDAALDAVAEGHSATMARTRTFAHVLREDGDLAARLARSGYAYRFASENIGFADTAAMAHRGIALSPAHLANLIDARVRRLGLGAVEGTSPDGDPGVYLTEVFANPIVGLRDPAAEVARTINAHRRKRGFQPLVRDARLDRVAEREARTAAFKGGPLVTGDAASSALAAAPGITSAAAWLAVGTQPDDALPAKDLDGPDWTRVGVGALYASSPTYGPGRLWVLVIVAR